MSVSVKDKMTKFVVSVTPRTTVREAWGVLTRIGFRHLPVVDNGSLVGMLSDRDILVYNPESGSLPETPVRECMTTTLVTCKSDVSIRDAATLMVYHQIDSLPVMDGKNLVGLITSTDILELVSEGHGPQDESLPWKFTVESIEETSSL